MKFWVSCDRFTVRVDTDDRDIITFAAPIVRRFIGQPFVNLARWIEKWHPFIEEL